MYICLFHTHAYNGYNEHVFQNYIFIRFEYRLSEYLLPSFLSHVNYSSYRHKTEFSSRKWFSLVLETTKLCISPSKSLLRENIKCCVCTVNCFLIFCHPKRIIATQIFPLFALCFSKIYLTNFEGHYKKKYYNLRCKTYPHN